MDLWWRFINNRSLNKIACLSDKRCSAQNGERNVLKWLSGKMHTGIILFD